MRIFTLLVRFDLITSRVLQFIADSDFTLNNSTTENIEIKYTEPPKSIVFDFNNDDIAQEGDEGVLLRLEAIGPRPEGSFAEFLDELQLNIVDTDGKIIEPC